MWKDQVYCDIDFSRIDDQASLGALPSAQQTTRQQNSCCTTWRRCTSLLCASTRASRFIPAASASPGRRLWLDGLSYSDIHYERFDPRANLSADGLLRGECATTASSTARGWEGFGWDAGDAVTYDITLPLPGGAPSCSCYAAAWRRATPLACTSAGLAQPD